MGTETHVIRPPIEGIMDGKVFRASTKYRNKMWFVGVFVAVMIWVIIIGTLGVAGYIAFVLLGQGWTPFWLFFEAWWWLLNIWYWIITAIWLIPGIIIVPIYIKSIEYSVIAKSGETMPEIYVKKGIINITHKHVPFRTITNISSRAGPFDRLFGIGNVEVETAGYSGASHTGPEEKISGVVFYSELRDFILRELRKFKGPYVTGTEVVMPEEEGVPAMAGTIEDEILRVLNDIRELLKRRRE